MPAPVVKKVVDDSEELTHKVTLVNGKSWTLHDKDRPASPWRFVEGIAVKVPERIALRLKDTAFDTVTGKVGQKITAVVQHKFEIEKIGAAPAAPAAPAV